MKNLSKEKIEQHKLTKKAKIIQYILLLIMFLLNILLINYVFYDMTQRIIFNTFTLILLYTLLHLFPFIIFLLMLRINIDRIKNWINILLKAGIIIISPWLLWPTISLFYLFILVLMGITH